MDSLKHEFSDFPIGKLDTMNWVEYADGTGYSVIAPLWKSPTEKSDLSMVFHITRQESGWIISIQDVHVL